MQRPVQVQGGTGMASSSWVDLSCMNMPFSDGTSRDCVACELPEVLTPLIVESTTVHAVHEDFGRSGAKELHNAKFSHMYNLVQETGFFATWGGSWDTPYGRFFMEWYSQAILDHGERLLQAVTSVFHTQHPRRCTLSNHFHSSQSIVATGGSQAHFHLHSGNVRQRTSTQHISPSHSVPVLKAAIRKLQEHAQSRVSCRPMPIDKPLGLCR